MISEEKKKHIYLALLVSLIIIATIFSSGYSRDSANYNLMFEAYGASGWGALPSQVFRREAFFLIVSKALYQFGLSSVFLYLIYSVTSLSVKFYLINKHSKDKWLSLSLFVSYFFILHDSTQIRFSIAVAFSYLGLHYLADGKRLLFSAIIVLSAAIFHVSSLVFMVMLFFSTKKHHLWLLGMVTFAILLYSVNLHTVFLGQIEGIINYFDLTRTFLNKLYSYLLTPSQAEHLGIFKPTMILVYASAAVLFQYRNKFSAYESLCYSALLLTIFFYILLHDIVDLQIRFRDMFFFSLVFLIPFIHEWLSDFIGKRGAYILLGMSFFVYLIKFLFYDRLLVI